MIRSSATLLAGALLAIAGTANAGTEADAASICMNDVTRLQQQVDGSSLAPTQRADASRMLVKARDFAEGGNVSACRTQIEDAKRWMAAARDGGGEETGQAPQSGAEIPATQRPSAAEGLTTGSNGGRSGGQQYAPQNNVQNDVGALVQNAGLTQIEGTPVVTADGEEIGDVEKVVQTPERQKTFLVVGVGGFLGLGDRDVAFALEEFEASGDGQFRLPKIDSATVADRPVYDESAYREVPLPDVIDPQSPGQPKGDSQLPNVPKR